MSKQAEVPADYYEDLELTPDRPVAWTVGTRAGHPGWTVTIGDKIEAPDLAALGDESLLPEHMRPLVNAGRLP